MKIHQGVLGRKKFDMLWVPIQLILSQWPNIRNEKIFRFFFLNILELQVWKFGQSVSWELCGTQPHDLLDLLNGEAPLLPLLNLLQPRTHVHQHDHDVPHQILQNYKITFSQVRLNWGFHNLNWKTLAKS